MHGTLPSPCLLTLEFIIRRPQLLPGLLSVIQVNVESRFRSQPSNLAVSLPIRRATAALNQVLKELASLKIPAGTQFMGKVRTDVAYIYGAPNPLSQVVAEVHPFLKSMYGQYATQLSISISPTSIGDPQVAADIEIAHYIYKCLSKVILWVWNRFGTRDTSDKQEVCHTCFRRVAVIYYQ